jgi:hypothetical protein
MRHILFAFFLGLAAASPAAANNDLAELDAYVVSAENRFEQMRLTPELIERMLAAAPAVLDAQIQLGRAMMEVHRSDKSDWDKNAERLQIMQTTTKLMQDATLAQGFTDLVGYERAFMTMQLVVMRDDLRRNTRHNLELAKTYRDMPLRDRMLAATSFKSAELRISATQQQPLPENVAAAEPFRERFMTMMARLAAR